MGSLDAVVGLGPWPPAAPFRGWPVHSGRSRVATGIGDPPADPCCLCSPRSSELGDRPVRTPLPGCSRAQRGHREVTALPARGRRWVAGDGGL